MVEFLRKFENRGIKMARVNSIRITKSINLLFILCSVGVSFDRGLFWSDYRDVYASLYIFLFGLTIVGVLMFVVMLAF